jgi:hypothetical protein
MMKVITNSLGSGDWIIVQGVSGKTLFSGHRVGARDLQEILDIVARTGCKLVEIDDEQMEEEAY